jgi:predicted amidohydrolase
MGSLRWIGLGVLLTQAFLAVNLSAQSTKPLREVRIVTVTQDGLRSSSPDLFDETMERLDRAASNKPDIAVLPETFLPEVEEVLPGPVTQRLSEWARAHSAYLLFGLKVRDGDALYNSAVLLDRGGQMVGRYDKIHPTEQELQRGIRPGAEDPPVFETDFGVIGVQVCFDVNWGEPWQKLADKGARVVFVPSAYPAARQLTALAVRHHYYIVSSTIDRPSRIYDISGETLASTGRFQPWAEAVLALDKQMFEIDYNMQKLRTLQKKYGERVEVEWFHDDDWFSLASRDPALPVDELVREFDLTPLAQYHERARQAVEDARPRP